MIDESDGEMRIEMEEFLQFNADLDVYEQVEVEAAVRSGNCEGAVGTALTWTEGLTKQLLHLYKTHHKRVGRSIPTMKKLYDLLTKLLNAQQNTNLKPSQVEHKMRNLVKGYKAVVDNNSKTGRGRKFFRYETEMEEIFGQNKNIRPTVLLNEKRVTLPTEPAKNLTVPCEPEVTISEAGDHEMVLPAPTNTSVLPSTSSIPCTPPRGQMPRRHTPSRSILRKSPSSGLRRSRTIRDAKLAEIIAMRKERAEFNTQYLQVMRKDAEDRATMRAIMTERNAILQKFLDKFSK